MKQIFALLLVATSLSLTSCYSDPSAGTGIIIVKDVNGFRVPVAEVRLFQQGSDIDVTGYTDINGEFSYVHEPALEVILNVVAQKGNLSGQSVIRIVPGKVTEEIIIIQ